MKSIDPTLFHKIMDFAIHELPDPLEWDEDYIFIPVDLHQSSISSTTKIDSVRLSQTKAVVVEFKKEHEAEKMIRWQLVSIKEL